MAELNRFVFINLPCGSLLDTPVRAESIKAASEVLMRTYASKMFTLFLSFLTIIMMMMMIIIIIIRRRIGIMTMNIIFVSSVLVLGKRMFLGRRSRIENQQTQTTCDANPWKQTQATMVGCQCSLYHYCSPALPALLICDLNNYQKILFLGGIKYDLWLLIFLVVVSD